MKFTIEHEENRCISFLDLSLIVKDNIIYTDWFHKRIFWSVLSYFSNHPKCHKIGTIYNLIERYYYHILFKKTNYVILTLLSYRKVKEWRIEINFIINATI